jgi:hypothetical protein
MKSVRAATVSLRRDGRKPSWYYRKIKVFSAAPQAARSGMVFAESSGVGRF